MTKLIFLMGMSRGMHKSTSQVLGWATKTLAESPTKHLRQPMMQLHEPVPGYAKDLHESMGVVPKLFGCGRKLGWVVRLGPSDWALRWLGCWNLGMEKRQLSQLLESR